MEKILKEKLTLNGYETTIKIYNSVKECFKCNWESLYFPFNDEEFASVKIKRDEDILEFSLITTGDINIIDKKTDETYTNNDHEVIKKIIETKEIYNEELYEVVDNNWFEILISLNNYTADSIVFCEEPKTIDDFKKALISIAKNVLESWSL